MASVISNLREYESALDVLKLLILVLSRFANGACWLNLGSSMNPEVFAIKMLETDHPKKTEALQLNAEIALADGEPPKAAEYLRKAAELDPYNHGVRSQFGSGSGETRRC